MELVFTAAGALLVVILLYMFLNRRSGNFNQVKQIPGPGFIEGVKVFVRSTTKDNLHHLIQKWVPIYGPLMRINLGVKEIVIFNDVKLFTRFVTEPPYRDVTNDRLPAAISQYITKGTLNLVHANFSPEQKGYRNLFHSLLKIYGEGAGQFESLLNETLTNFKAKLSFTGNAEISRLSKNYILDLLRIVMTGDALKNVPGNLDVVEDFDTALALNFSFEHNFTLRVLPAVRFIPFSKFKYCVDRMLKAKDNLFEMYFNFMEKTYVPGVNRGIVDNLLCRRQNYSENGGDLKIDDGMIKSLIGNIIGAGFVTTSNTLNTLLLNITANQDVQERLYKDIKEVIGDDIPSIRHRKHLPFVDAVIQETLRLNSVAPVLIPHAVRSDIIFDGYFFPKGTLCVMNTWHTHHNGEIWEDPWNFHPERFLNEKGERLDSLRDELIPFGKGRRSCVGESFAKFRLFIIVTTFVQSFRFLPPDPPAKLPSTDPREYTGGLVGAPNFMCKIQKR